jgi:hypothetical protein
MNARRAAAYTNLMRELAKVATEIDPGDEQAIRDAADTRLFARSAAPPVESALERAEETLERLVTEGRVAPSAGDHIAHYLEACGPAASSLTAPRG